MTTERNRPIVVGVDGSALAEAALRWARAEVVGGPAGGKAARVRLDPVGAYCATHARCPVVIVPVPRRSGEAAEHIRDAIPAVAR